MKAADRDFSSISVGEEASFTHTITAIEVDTFGALSGDLNPLHMDEDYARSTSHRERVVHGMFLGALMSRLVGMQLPGKRALLVRQSLDFKKEVHIGDVVTVHGCVKSKSESTRLLEVAIILQRMTEKVATGSVYVRVE
jgi:phosphate acetyltransferase